MPETVGNLRQEAGNDVVDITTPDGSELTVHVDPESRQIVRIASMAYHSNLGDVEAATAFRDYADAGGLMLPGAITKTIDGQPTSVLRLSHTVDADVGDLSAPADVAAAPEPGPPRRQRDGRGARRRGVAARRTVPPQRAGRAPRAGRAGGGPAARHAHAGRHRAGPRAGAGQAAQPCRQHPSPLRSLGRHSGGGWPKG